MSSLTDLPLEPLSKILNLTVTGMSDISTILELGAVNTKIHECVLHSWKCASCDETVYVEDGARLVERENSDGVIHCGSCGKKYCGQQRTGRGSRRRHDCSSARKCQGCDLVECRECLVSKLEVDCAMCCRLFLSGGYCASCQGGLSNQCNLCGFPVCDRHAKKCDTCGLMTCGVHDFDVDTCSSCNKSYCARCHGHGDSMWHCGRCKKHSCNANGDGNGNCPNFVFDYYDWPVCQSCHEEIEDEFSSEFSSDCEESSSDGDD